MQPTLPSAPLVRARAAHGRGPRMPGLPELIARWRGLLTWLVLPAVALVVLLHPERLQLAVKLLLAGGAVLAVSRRPDLGALSLVVGLPFQLLGLSYLYAHGVPSWLVRPLGLWKEAVVAGCALAAVRAWRAAGHRPDAIDWAAAGYLGIVALYYAFPAAFVASNGVAAGPPTERLTLNVAFRTQGLFVVLLIAIRHLDLSPRFRDRFVRTVLAVGLVVAAIAIVELVFSDRWNDLMVGSFQIYRYKLQVLGVATNSPDDVRVYGVVGGIQIVRIGSVFLDQLQCGMYLVVPFIVGLHRLLRGANVAVAAGFGVISVALVGTQTRAALLAVGVAGILVLRPHVGIPRASRARIGALLIVGALALLPVAVGTGLVQRTLGGTQGDDGSTQVHLQRSKAALDTFLRRPFGRGLGTGARTASRFDVKSKLLSENYYLEVANETGVISIVFFGVLVVVVTRRLGAHRNDGDPLAAAWRAAFVGLSVAGLLLYVWESLALAWMIWIGVGLILRSAGPGENGGAPEEREVLEARELRGAGI